MVRTHTPETADAAPPQSPHQLADLHTVGAAVGGVRVLKAVLYLEDGRRLVLDLPAPVPPPKDWAKTKAGKAILDVLAVEGRRMKGQSIARVAGLEYSGSFRQTLKGLAGTGEILHDDGEYELPE